MNHSELIGDKYQVLEVIGQGGMGIVLKARNIALDKVVALKVLNAALLVDKSSRGRFEVETKAGAKLNHPHLVAVFDSGFTSASEPFLVMEYIQGASLDRFLAQNKLELSELLQFFIQISKALRYLHDNKIIHRDLKTSNIMIQTIGHERYAKLLDLGIAKVFSAQGETASRLTSTGTIFGSAHYMSPEQCQGHKVDERSDIYSFGCVLYECLSGRLPFSGEPLQVMFKHLHEAPAPIPHRNPAEYDLRMVTEKCLAKDPNQRFQTVTDLIEALKSIELRLRGGTASDGGILQSQPQLQSQAQLQTRTPRQENPFTRLRNSQTSQLEVSKDNQTNSYVPAPHMQNHTTSRSNIGHYETSALPPEAGDPSWTRFILPSLAVVCTAVAVVVCVNAGNFHGATTPQISAPHGAADKAVSSTASSNAAMKNDQPRAAFGETVGAGASLEDTRTDGIRHVDATRATNPRSDPQDSSANREHAYPSTNSGDAQLNGSANRASAQTPQSVLARYGLDSGASQNQALEPPQFLQSAVPTAPYPSASRTQMERARFEDQARRMSDAASANTEATIDSLNKMAQRRREMNNRF